MRSTKSVEQNFHLYWCRVYGRRTPLSHLLRQDKSVPWVRFHALPNSKRYAEHDDETAVILERAYTLGNAVLEDGTECWQIECRHADHEHAHEYNLPGTFIFNDDAEQSCWVATVTKTKWRMGEHDPLLRSIADDATGPTLWLHGENATIFAPYDGGFDVFPASFQKADELRTAFRQWLSPHPEGL